MLIQALDFSIFAVRPVVRVRAWGRPAGDTLVLQVERGEGRGGGERDRGRCVAGRRGSRDAVLGETGLGGWEVEVDGEGTLVGSERWGMCDGRAANWNAGGVDWRAESEAVCPCFDGRWAVGGGCDAEGRRRRCAAGVTGAAGASAE